MLLALLTGTLALAPDVQVDTTLNAVRGQRLAVNAYAGEVTVRAWNRNAVRIEADGDQNQLEIASSPTGISIRTQGRHGPPEEITIRISAPAWIGLSLAGVNTSANLCRRRTARRSSHRCPPSKNWPTCCFYGDSIAQYDIGARSTEEGSCLAFLRHMPRSPTFRWLPGVL